MRRFDVREHAPSILVAALSSAFGVALLEIIAALTQLIREDDVTGSSAFVAYVLGIIGFVFITIAVYVGAIVTANTFATIIAGRTRTIALMRLIGSSAANERRSVAREGLAVGVIGAAIGAVTGTAVTYALLLVGHATGFATPRSYAVVEPTVILPIVVVVLTTWLASWAGSRRVLNVSPMQATGNAVESSREQTLARPGRTAVAITLFAIGTCLLALGILVGLVNPVGVLIGVVGGVLSFTGLVLGAHLIMPPALRLTGRLLGTAAPARLAAENAVRYPERSSRTTIGLVIGVTLITMFAVTMESFRVMIHIAQEAQPQVYEGTDQMLGITVAVFSVLMGFSALIAAVGMVNNLSLSVLQRTRELGLLRALGFTARQVRVMILAESAQLTAASVLVGLVFGIGYGWAGAQSMLGSANGVPGLVPPAVPLPLLGIVALAAVVLTVSSSITPSRRATRVTPVAALAVE
jgi:putative ABC transport system permease protein